LEPLTSQNLTSINRPMVVDYTKVLMLSMTDEMEDIYKELVDLREQLNPSTRIYVITVSRLWGAFRRIIFNQTKTTPHFNWIPPTEINNFLYQAGFEVVEQRNSVLIPFYIPILSKLINRWSSQIPILRHLSVFTITTARPLLRSSNYIPSVSIIVAARNEVGNIKNLIQRLPILSPNQELIFVEGGSQDQTWETIQEAIKENQKELNYPILAFKQTGKGKGDAVRLGFSKASGDILVILDADLSVPPEELPRFIENLRLDKCEFANGSRLVYPMEKQAMQFLNLVGNRLFGITFSFLIGQPIRDTLCGTKALWAADYKKLALQRSYFGEFDPFGDFDLIFGAARLGLKIRDVPVHYKARVYGSTNISRFRHGILLLKMTSFAARRLRFL
ncbi:MAG: glycosyltransferase family 2 protein, partial [Acidimicrobiaceae bacterium]